MTVVAAASALMIVGLVVPADAVYVPPVTAGTLASANPADNTPHARNGEARAFAEIGTTVFVGGSFTQVRTAANATWLTKNYIFAYDRNSGAFIGSFNPVLDGAVNALAVTPDGTKLIVGGAFRNVNGVLRRNLVALNPTTGATAASWTGVSDGGNVRTLKVNNGFLYVGGAFNWLNGTSHNGLARVNGNTGAIDPTFNINATVGRHGTSSYVWTLDVSPNGHTLVAGGNFTLVNGQSRNQLVKVNLNVSPPSLADFSTERFVPPCAAPGTFVHYLQDVDFSDDGSYFVIATNGGGGWPAAYCDTLLRYETSASGSNQDATWVDLTGNDSLTSVEAADGVIYTGGHFRWLNNPNRSDAAGPGAIDRLGVGAVDASNGMPLNWNSRRSGAPAGTTPWGSTVPVIWRGSTGVYFGHNSDGMGNEYHGRLGMWPMAGGRSVNIANAPTTTPGYLYLGTAANQLTKVAFNGTALGATTVQSQPNLTNAAVTMRVGPNIWWASGSQMGFSTFNGTTVGAPWYTGFNSWFNPSTFTGAFYLDGRIYYTKPGSNSLFYRYGEPDGYYIGATEFTIPTANVTWSNVRGMAWVNGKVVYGNVDGSLHSATFDPAAANAVDGATSTPIQAAGGPLSWSKATLFFSTQ